MGKLHELLAIESNVESAATKLLNETTQTFKNKEALFKGKHRTLQLFGKTEENRVEFDAIEAKDSVRIPVAATVPGNLNYLGTILADYYDVVAQKESTNQIAKADLVVGNLVIGKDLPATFLLGLETKFKNLRVMLEEIPTMSPGVIWKEAPEIGNYIYKSDPTKDIKTAKSVDHKMLPQPNANIAVQYVPIDINKNIGEFTEVQSTGLINSADKARLIERLDTLLKEIKKARQRANNVDTVNTKVGDAMMGYLFGAWYDREKANPGARV